MLNKVFLFRRLCLRISFGIFISSSILISSEAQISQTVDLELIHQKQVRNYLIDNEINTLDNFSSIQPSWQENTDEAEFHKHEKVFRINENISEVWKCYNIASPVKSWNGRFVRFVLLISKSSNSVMYASASNFSEIDTGQVYFLDLKLLKGLFNVPVAFEIITVDEANKVIEFSYIDGNKSQGKQVLQFLDNGDGSTRIVHQSFFKSGSRLRDGFFYPYYHTKIIKQFHRNMRNLVLALHKQDTDLS